MEKYYLLKFCEDHGDEFNVCAIECFTQEQYNKFLIQKLGKENPKYEEEVKEYNIKNSSKRPLKGKSYLRAYLGNYSKYFEEAFHNYLTGQDFINDNTVKVTIVTKEFYDLFHKANLNSINLCNIFECEGFD